MTVNMVCCKDMYDSNCELGRIRTRSQLGEPIVPLSGVFLMCRNILIGTFESKSIGCDCLTWEEKYICSKHFFKDQDQLFEWETMAINCRGLSMLFIPLQVVTRIFNFQGVFWGEEGKDCLKVVALFTYHCVLTKGCCCMLKQTRVESILTCKQYPRL